MPPTTLHARCRNLRAHALCLHGSQTTIALIRYRKDKRKEKEDETTEKRDKNPLKRKLRLMCSIYTGASPGRREGKDQKCKKQEALEELYQKRQSCAKELKITGAKKMVPEKGPEFWGLQEDPQANLSLTEESAVIWS